MTQGHSERDCLAHAIEVRDGWIRQAIADCGEAAPEGSGSTALNAWSSGDGAAFVGVSALCEEPGDPCMAHGAASPL